MWGILGGESKNRLVLGSHLDSVPDGGNLDGAYGTLAGLEILRGAASLGAGHPELAVIAFADEEGARFGPSLGSAGLTGTAQPCWSALVDSSGVTLAEAARECGVDVARANEAVSGLERVGAYFELHIEQGPALEHAGRPLAVVTGTVAMRRERLMLDGVANHAAATPMQLRHNALAAAAEVVTAVREIATGTSGAIGTVAEISVAPNVWSVVASRVELIVDMRAPADEAAGEMFAALHEKTKSTCTELGVKHNWTLVREHTFKRSIPGWSSSQAEQSSRSDVSQYGL